MADILIRKLNQRFVQRLKAQAKQHGRSLQSEAKMILEKGAQGGAEETAKILAKWKKRFAGREFLPSSADLIREDRNR